MKRVYIAGAYSAPDVISMLGNVRRGLQAAALVRKAGFSPFAPWSDLLLHLQEGYDLQTCYETSMAWLEVSDAVLVVPEGAETSNGTQAEIVRAEELRIPVFHHGTVDMALWAMQRHFGDGKPRQECKPVGARRVLEAWANPE